MADLLERASAWLDEQRLRHASRVVTYARGGRTLEVSATIGRTVFEGGDGSGMIVQYESRDYLIRAADLALDGQPFLPQCGDRVQEVQGSRTFVYEILAPGDGPCWRYSDPYRQTLRIHTKYVQPGGN